MRAAGEVDLGGHPAGQDRARYLLVLLVLIYITQSIDRTVISVLVEPLKLEYGLSDAQIGILSGFAFTVPFGLAVLPMGWLVDRVSRRNLICGTLTIWSVLTACCAFATSFAMLLLARIGVGAAESAAQPASLSLIADAVPRERRNTAVSVYYSGASAGQIVTFLVGGWLLLHFGWRAVFLLAGLPGILLAILFFTTVREPVRGAYDKAEMIGGLGLGGLLRAIFRRRPLVHAITANMISVSVQFALNVWLISFLSRVHAVPVAKAAIWVGLGLGVVMTFGSLLIGPLADRYSRGDPARLAAIPAAGAIGVALTGTLMVLTPSLTLALAALAALALCAGCLLGPSYSLLLTLAPPDARGSSLAFAKLVTIAIGNSALTWFAGAASDMIGTGNSIRWALLLVLMFNLWAAFHYWRVGVTARRLEAPA